MKRFIALLSFTFALSALAAEDLMVNLQDASDQVVQDSLAIVGDGTIYTGAITFEGRPIVMGDLFSDLVANRFLGNDKFKGQIVKGYMPGSFRLSDAQWVLSGSLYKTGNSGYFLSLYLNDSQGRQKKGWEFMLPAGDTESLLGASKMAAALGGDIYEPNDSNDQAAEIKPDPKAELDGLEIGKSGDEDWFYFNVDKVSSGSDMYLLDARTSGDTDTYMELYGPGDTSPVAENDDGSDSNATINYAIDRKGRWSLMVRGYSSEDTGDYNLSVGLEMKKVGPGEPDNSISEAAPLQIGGSELNRTIDYADDYDYYRIELDKDLPADKALVVQTYGSLDLTMTLLDKDGNEVQTNDDSGNDGNPQVMIPALKKGVWFAVVYPYDGGNTGAYTIRAYTMDVKRDEYESDDSMEEAHEIKVNGPPQERSFMPAGEEDWAKFTVDEPGDYIMKTTGPIDTHISLYNENGDFLYEDDDSGNDNNAMLSEHLDKGVYYLQITQYEGDGNIEDTYALSVKRY